MCEPKFKPGDKARGGHSGCDVEVLDGPVLRPGQKEEWYLVKYRDGAHIVPATNLVPAGRWEPCKGKHRVTGPLGYGSGHDGPWERLVD